ncbi:alpha-1-antitrypsin-like [Caloenas nicobarica]|uniref:alpha-1-antitrypsin-like n=1 Tax=Caloenas nicobarica TaxID=187106 RepID=UPI0032B80F1F
MKPVLHLCLLLLGVQVQGQCSRYDLSDEQQVQNIPHSPEEHSQAEGEKLAHVKIAPSNADFAFRFYKQVREEAGNKNIFFSPVSISTAFVMLSLGARSNTLTQLHNGLAFNLTEVEEQEIHEGFQHLLQLLNDPHQEVQLTMGNALFIDNRLKLLQKFLDDVTNFYYSEVISSNFQNSADATQEINKYIEIKTHGKIVDLLKSLDLDTMMVLVNYIFFKGYWEKPFNDLETRDDDFLLDAKNSVKVKMMHKHKDFNIHRDEKLSCWVVEIPYKGKATALFVLPDEGTMKQVEDALLKETVSNWMQSLKKRKIYLDLPKFTISGSYDVKRLFEKMGVTEVFSDQADLSAVAEKTLLKVSKAIHKAVVAVSEQGTEAAAVTVIEIVPTSACTEFSLPPYIRFNRPFLVMIFDETTHSILFVGKIVNPAAAED